MNLRQFPVTYRWNSSINEGDRIGSLEAPTQAALPP